MNSRFPWRWLCFAVPGLLLLSSGWVLRSVWQNSNIQSSREKPVAAIGNELLYEKDYAPSLVAAIQRIRTDEYDVKRRALEGTINKRLVQAEASKRGMT